MTGGNNIYIYIHIYIYIYINVAPENGPWWKKISTVAVIFHSRLKLLDGIWNHIIWDLLKDQSWKDECAFAGHFGVKTLVRSSSSFHILMISKFLYQHGGGFGFLHYVSPGLGSWHCHVAHEITSHISLTFTDKSRCIHENQWEVFHSKIQASWLISCLALDRLMLWLVHFFHPGRGGQFQWVETSNEQYLMKGLGT